MSKYVKSLLSDQFARRLEGVEDALLVDVMGLDANSSVALRRRLRDKDINLMVIRNGLARRATEGTPLAAALEGMEGSLAFCWGAEDFVSLAKEISKLDADKEEFVEFRARGGVMDGEQLSPERVKEISKWPSRTEQLSILLGQILGPGAEVAGAIVGPGGTLASQIKQKSEEGEE
ncbi:MAG: 50S ribosomal protein L10 [Planctomycetales bacterium]|nr:50S ribosomal protein L10 [Planctomycetales bacterium]